MRRRLTRAKAIGALALALAALSLAVPGLRHADAALQTQESCGSTGSTAVAIGNQFECDFVITSADGPVTPNATTAATLTITIPPALNLFFFGPGVIGTLPNNCTA
ncbi:MAG TPA: hypothetical protein VKV26_24285, partial [Dehalococcoidia bacterium]|nr:hypothetical protein [Dehalococcoidia bacterium]